MKTKNSFYYRVQEGDTINSLVKTLNTEQEKIMRNRTDIPLYAGEWVFVETNDYVVHHVKPTETLETIAKQYNLSVEKLTTDNNLNNTKLFIGQKLKIYKQSNK